MPETGTAVPGHGTERMFGQLSVKFLRLVMDGQGIRPDSDKSAINGFPTPTNVSDV